MSSEDPRGGGGLSGVAEPSRVVGQAQRKQVPLASRRSVLKRNNKEDILTIEEKKIINNKISDFEQNLIINNSVFKNLNNLKTKFNKNNIDQSLNNNRRTEKNVYDKLSQKIKLLDDKKKELKAFYETLTIEGKVYFKQPYNQLINNIDELLKNHVNKLQELQETIVDFYNRIIENINNEIYNLLEKFNTISLVNNKIMYIDELQKKVIELKAKSNIIQKSFDVSVSRPTNKYGEGLNKVTGYINSNIIPNIEGSIKNRFIPIIKDNIKRIKNNKNREYHTQLGIFNQCLSQFFNEVNILDNYFKQLKSKINSAGINDIDLTNVENYYRVMKNTLKKIKSNINLSNSKKSRQSVNIAAQISSSSGGGSVVSV